MEEVVKDLIRIEITRLAKTGMLIGICPSIRGLIVHGRDVEEMETRIPGEIERMVDHLGATDIRVKKLQDAGTDDQQTVFTVLRYEVVLRKRAVAH